MLMFKTIAFAGMASLCLANSAAAQAPRAENRFASTVVHVAPSHAIARESFTAQQPHRVGTARLVAGGLAGGVVGFFAGGYTGAKIADSPDDYEGFDTLIGAVLGASIGESLG